MPPIASPNSQTVSLYSQTALPDPKIALHDPQNTSPDPT